jgi:hypothetical protein
VSWVAAEHRHARAKFGATKGNHVFTVKILAPSRVVNEKIIPDMSSDHFTMMMGSIPKDVLDQVVPILVGSNCIFD